MSDEMTDDQFLRQVDAEILHSMAVEAGEALEKTIGAKLVEAGEEIEQLKKERDFFQKKMEQAAKMTQTNLLYQLEQENLKLKARLVTVESLLQASVGVFQMYDKAVTKEEFREARSCRLSVKFAAQEALK